VHKRSVDTMATVYKHGRPAPDSMTLTLRQQERRFVERCTLGAAAERFGDGDPLLVAHLTYMLLTYGKQCKMTDRGNGKRYDVLVDAE
jgi:hypothetical protein